MSDFNPQVASVHINVRFIYGNRVFVATASGSGTMRCQVYEEGEHVLHQTTMQQDFILSEFTEYARETIQRFLEAEDQQQSED